MHDVGKMRKTKPRCAVKLSCNNSTTLISVLLYRECVIYSGNKQHRHLCQILPWVLKLEMGIEPSSEGSGSAVSEFAFGSVRVRLMRGSQVRNFTISQLASSQLQTSKFTLHKSELTANQSYQLSSSPLFSTPPHYPVSICIAN